MINVMSGKLEMNVSEVESKINKLRSYGSHW